MSFKTNDCQQITFNDVLWGLTDREKRMLEKSWAKPFAERIFPLIDESKFACLYSDKASRPNTPVNICVGALILKELFNMTDEEMVDSLVFDVLSQRFRKTWQFEFLSRVRNGVETVPSILRRRYHIDTMPVRGKIRTKHMFGFKIGALNFRKLLKYLSSREKCALNPETV